MHVHTRMLLCCGCPSACLWKVGVIVVEGYLEGLGWRKSLNRKLGWGTLNCMITIWSVDHTPSHLVCSCSQHTVFWLSFFPQRLEFSLKGRKSFILLVEDATHFWFFFFCSVLKAASGSPTHQISDLPETIQRGRYTSVCFFLSIFGHFSKSHHISWQKNEMKDVFPAVKCQNCSNLTWTVCEG